MATAVQRRQTTEIRRSEIAEAAGAVMVRRGCEHTTIKEIAKEIGLSEGAVYRHFRNKRDIIRLMVEHAEASLSDDIERSFAPRRKPLRVLEHALRNHVSSIKERRGASFQVIAEVVSLGDKKLNMEVFAALDRYTDRIRDLISAGVKAGELREDLDPDAAARLVTSVIQGLVNSWSLSNYEFDLEEQYELLWCILRAALVRNNAIALGADRD